MKIIILSFLILFTTMTSNVFACSEIRAAFDIGSGETKMKIAEVDYCTHKIKKMILDNDEARDAVAYKSNLKRSGSDGNFTKEIMDQGISVLNRLKKLAIEYKATSFKAVATSAFRKAKNGEAFISRISEDVGIEIKIISQEKEAEYGFFGAIAKIGSSTQLKIEDIVVWDIGGGSMQLTTMIDGKMDVALLPLGSVPYKNFLLSLRKNSKKGGINPLKESTGLNLDQLIRKSMKLMAKHMGPKNAIRKKLERKDAQIVGIGGVHYYGMRDNLNEYDRVKKQSIDISNYSVKRVENAFNFLSSYKDQEIIKMLPEKSRPYYANCISNLALILSSMKELKVENVLRLNITMADAILVR